MSKNSFCGFAMISVAVLCFAVLPNNLNASSLQVYDTGTRPGIAKAGTHGLEIAAGTTCTAAADYVVPDGNIAGPSTEEGCLTLTAADVDITGGDVTFKAGDSITLQNGFSVASGASFTATLEQALTGRAYVQDNSPTGEQLYRARLYLDLNTLSPASGESFRHFTAYGSDGSPMFYLELRESGGNVALDINARDGGTFPAPITAESSLTSSGYLGIEFEWKASDAGMNNGHLDVWIDDVAATGLSGLNNETQQIDFIRWGVIDPVTNSTTGALWLDEFVSQRSSSAIGLLP